MAASFAANSSSTKPRPRLNEARFDLIDENGLTQRIEGEKVAESWDKSSKVWSGAFKLGFKSIAAGDYNLIIEIPSLTAVPQLIKKMKLALF